jgi:rod shape-determining protein MreC
MLNLLNFLWKNYAFFLFVLLQIAALSMLVSSGHQSAVFSYSSNQIGGRMLNSWESVMEYFKLKKVNEELSAENVRLRNQLNQKKTNDIDLSFPKIITNDSTPDTISAQILQSDSSTKHFDFLVAKVISNSIHKQKNYLMLNKGSRHGIANNMGVIGPKGVVGIVNSLSKDYCTVIPIISISSKISSKIKNNNELGTLIWDGQDHKTAQLINIESYIEINVGDSVVTSGYSYIFPEGLMLGTVRDYYTNEGANTFSVLIDLSTNFSSLKYVSIARNLNYQEQLLLKENMEASKQ